MKWLCALCSVDTAISGTNSAPRWCGGECTWVASNMWLFMQAVDRGEWQMKSTVDGAKVKMRAMGEKTVCMGPAPQTV
eukprot:6491854-Amphidinium_carterae.1